MKNYGILFLFLTLMSCSLFTSEKKIREKLVKEEIQSINWNDLDRYPLFESCDETANKPTQKACFETTLTRHLQTALQQHQFTVTETIRDTVWLHLLVNNQGNIIILTIEKNKATADALPQLDRIFNNSIESLPRLYPPLKRDIPVAAKFKLPVILHVE